MSRRLSIRLSWPFTQLGGSDATKHTRKSKGFHAAGDLICLSAHLSLHFGSTVDTAVDSSVVDCLKLFSLSERLSHMFHRLSCCLSWLFARLGGSDPNKHTRKAGYFHAAGELFRLSARLSLHFGLPVDTPVVDCLKLIHLSARLSCMVVSPVEPPVTLELATCRYRDHAKHQLRNRLHSSRRN
jgi:hypothetical protein